MGQPRTLERRRKMIAKDDGWKIKIELDSINCIDDGKYRASAYQLTIWPHALQSHNVPKKQNF